MKEDTSGQSENCPVYSRGLIYISAFVCLCVLKVHVYGLCAGPCVMMPFPTNSGKLGKGI
jgi:hypothetical protein